MLSQHVPNTALAQDAGMPRQVDGRTARRERGRVAVIDAVLELLDEGHVRLSVDEVAKRSGVSTASVFRYVENLDELHRLAFERKVEQVLPMLRIEGLGEMPLEQRTEAFARGRLDVYDAIAGPARMGRARAVDHPIIAESLAEARRRWLTQVREVFAAELARMSRTEQRDAAALVDTVASFESYELLRTTHGLPRRVIARLWASTIAHALSAGAARGG
ncbi:MAG: TetR/AcrR family transcriptional regulator [Acidimicrobiales bacterium]|nr:TetR/AcrR family transcriptional regulator [Acidimicrobiales bacterium]